MHADDTTVRFSVVVNNYNYADYLAQAIDSALSQLTDDDELIIVDDGSTDSSQAVLENYKDLPNTTLIAQANTGQIGAVRAGIAAARNNTIALLDSDDYFLPGYLDRLRSIYDHDGEVSFVFSKPEVGGEDAEQARNTRHMLARMSFAPGRHSPSRYATLMNYEFVGTPTSGLSMRRSLAQRIMLLPSAIEQPSQFNPLLCRVLNIPARIAEHSTPSADGIIVRCASLLEAVKYYNDVPGFFYRIHGSNRYAALSPLARWYIRSHRKSFIVDIATRTFNLPPVATASELREEFRQRALPQRKRRRLRIRLSYALASLRARGSMVSRLNGFFTALGSR